MSDNRNDLPSVNSPNFNQRLRETIQTYLGRQGDPLERGLTLRDLLESGLAKLPSGFKLATGAAKIPLQPGDSIGASYEADLTPPPPPTGFTVSAGISHILIEHDAPLYRAGHGHLRTRVYGAIRAPGAAAPVFSDAIEVAQFSGTVYAHPTNPSTTWHLWIKWETADGVLSAGPAGGTNGVVVKSGEDVSALVAAMTGPGNPFKVVPSEITLPDGTVVPPGTYTADAFIQNGQIVNAKIANLAVDDAKIATVSVDKLTAGSIAVGQYIQSTSYIAGQQGWRINGDGSAEFGFASIRGTLLASQIGVNSITADKIDARGLVIKDALGSPIIQAGSAIDWSKLGGKSQNLAGLGYTGALDATNGAPAGTYVGNTLAENVESTAGAQAKVSAAQAALQAYTDAETAAAEVRAKAYADGVVTAEETRAIADAQAKADAARVAAINAAALDATNKATAAQTAAQDYAAAQAALAEVSAKAYADGVVDAEEARAIADAQAKADAAKDAAIAAAALDATTKSNAAQTAAQVYAAAQASLAEVTAKAYADGIVDAEEARAIADATAKANAAKDAAISAAAADATTKANDVKATVEAYAAAQAALAETQAKAYADGVVDAEEARAIADATAKAEAARVAAVNAAALDATDKANAAQSAAISSAATDATTKANAVLATSLQKAGDAITGPVTFLTNGGILAATDADNGVFMGPNGLVGKKAGVTTFAVDTSGNASFGGALNAATGSFAGNLSAARGTFSGSLSAAGGTFAGTLTAAAVNAVNTINLAGNSVTVPVSKEITGNIPSDIYNGASAIVTTDASDFGGGRVIIRAEFSVIFFSVDDTGYKSIKFFRNGALLRTVYAGSTVQGAEMLVSVSVVDLPPSGSSHTYGAALTQPNGSNMTWAYKRAMITADGSKR